MKKGFFGSEVVGMAELPMADVEEDLTVEVKLELGIGGAFAACRISGTSGGSLAGAHTMVKASLNT